MSAQVMPPAPRKVLSLNRPVTRTPAPAPVRATAPITRLAAKPTQPKAAKPAPKPKPAKKPLTPSLSPEERPRRKSRKIRLASDILFNAYPKVFGSARVPLAIGVERRLFEQIESGCLNMTKAMVRAALANRAR